jgi:quercetin dioxygenase-like cupin family protein
MAYSGQMIDNPVSGERIEFLRTAADTNGELLEIELTLDPGGRVPAAHVHPEQEERFHVLEGTMKFRLGLRTIVAHAGDTVTVPAGRVHKFANAGDGRRALACRSPPRSIWRTCSPPPSSSPTRARCCRPGCPSRCTSRSSSSASAAKSAPRSRPHRSCAP